MIRWSNRVGQSGLRGLNSIWPQYCEKRTARSLRRSHLWSLLVLAVVMTGGIPAQAIRWLPTPETAEAPDEQEPGDGQVDINTGAAQLQIPISVPPGPGGLQPDVTLSYSSQQGDGPFGVGWRLELGEIRCSARYGVPDYSDCPQFELDGQLLVMDPTNPGRYHTEVESFKHIVAVGRFQIDRWEVTLSNGTKMTYGSNENSLVRTDGASGARARWLLDKIVDTDGNRITVTYDRADQGVAYPVQISYASGFRNVTFIYENRPDETHDFKGGIERFIMKRLREIRVMSGADVFQRRIFGYSALSEYTTERSRLTWTQLFGTGCLTTELLAITDPATLPVGPCRPLPAQRFDYTDSPPGPASNWVASSAWEPPVEFKKKNPGEVEDESTADVGVRHVDVNGDGRTDIIQAYCTQDDWPCAAPSEGWRQVYLNTGTGWDSTSPEAVAYTTSLRNLTYEQPSVNILMLDDSGNPLTDYSPNTAQFGRYACDLQVTPLTRGVVFSERPYYLNPALKRVDETHNQGAIEEKLQDEYTYRPKLSWQIVDLDGDGLPDLVTSEAFGGIAQRQKKCDNTTPAPGEEFVPGAAVRIAFRNTGSGWVPDNALASGLPLFSSVMINDWMSQPFAGDCRTSGGTFKGGYEFGRQEMDLSGYHPCLNIMRFHPKFTELDGDGKPELIALEPDSHEIPVVTMDSSAAASISTLNSFNSRAWAYDESGATPQWVHAEEFDLPIHHIYTSFMGCDPYSTACGQWDADVGVRFADLNRDGLTDVVWMDPVALCTGDGGGGGCSLVLHLDAPSQATGVLLNRGAGTGAEAAWCSSAASSGGCPDAKRYVPPESLAKMVLGPFPIEGSHPHSDQYPWAFATTGTGLQFGDLNGDGWVDLYDHWNSDKNETHLNPGSFAWLHEGAQVDSVNPGTIWMAADLDRFMPPHPEDEISGDMRPNSFHDVNGDGIIDALFSAFIDGDGYPVVADAQVSQISYPDLVETYDNGRGGTIAFVYGSSAAREDSDLQANAMSHATDVGEIDVGTERWSSVPVVTEITVSGLNRTASTSLYSYADPRWDEASRAGLGFRLVEQERADNSLVRNYFYQARGRAGALSERNIWDGSTLLYQETETWEVASGPSCAACPTVPGSIPETYVGRVTETKSTNEYGTYIGENAGPERKQTYTYDDTYGFNFVASVQDTTPNHILFTTLRNPYDDAGALSNWLIGLVEDETVQEGSVVHTQTVYEYWETGRIKSQTQDAGSRDGPIAATTIRTEWSYDSFGNLIQERDPKGRDTYYCYDGDSTFSGGGMSCPSFSGQDSHSVRVGQLDPAGSIAIFEPEFASGKVVLTLSAYADIPGRRQLLDPFGRVKQESLIDLNGTEIVTSTITYRDFGDPGVIDVPHVETDHYVTQGGSDTIRTATYEDGFGRTWRTVQEAREDGTTSYVGTATYLDVAGRTQRETYPVACADQHCSNLIGDTEGPATSTTVDPLGRVTQLTTPDGTELWSYFPAGEGGLQYDAALVQRANGGFAQHLVHQGRIAWAYECSAGSVSDCQNPDRTSYTYLPSGELSEIFDAHQLPNESKHRFVYRYDRVGRATRIEDPDAGIGIFGYDETGNLISQTNARNQVVSYDYEISPGVPDPLDRLRSIVPPASEEPVAIEYTAGYQQRTGVSSARFSKVFGYDDLGRLAQEQLIVDSETFVVDIDHDLLDRQTEIEYPGTDTVVTYEYDGPNLERVCELNGKPNCSRNGTTPYVSDVIYDALGRREEVHTSAGVRTFTYHSANQRLQQDNFQGSGPDNYALRKTFETYDGLGNILNVTGSTSAGDIEVAASYAYDHRGRLQSWSRPGGVSEAYDYDKLGNLILKGAQTNLYEHPDKPHAITSRTVGEETIDYTYDLDGNVASAWGGPQHYTYDSQNRMTCVGSNAGECDHLTVLYDEKGLRIEGDAWNQPKIRYIGDLFIFRGEVGSQGPQGRSFIYAFGQRIATKLESKVTLRQPASAPLAFFGPLVPPLLGLALLGCGAWLLILGIQGGVPQAIAARPLEAAISLSLVALLVAPQAAFAGKKGPGGGGGNVVTQYFTIADGIGSTVLELEADGSRFANASYTPFGTIDQEYNNASGSINRLYAGHQIQFTTGFYYMKARWYDPVAGRFAAVDPVIENIHDPQTLNGYSYVGNNPINFNDPTGACRIACGVIGAKVTVTTMTGSQTGGKTTVKIKKGDPYAVVGGGSKGGSSKGGSPKGGQQSQSGASTEHGSQGTQLADNQEYRILTEFDPQQTAEQQLGSGSGVENAISTTNVEGPSGIEFRNTSDSQSATVRLSGRVTVRDVASGDVVGRDSVRFSGRLAPGESRIVPLLASSPTHTTVSGTRFSLSSSFRGTAVVSRGSVAFSQQFFTIRSRIIPLRVGQSLARR